MSSMDHPKGRIRLVSDSPRLLQSAKQPLDEAHWDVACLQPSEIMSCQGRSLLPEVLAIDLETPGVTDQVVAQLLQSAKMKPQSGTQVLLLLRSTQEERLRELFKIAPTHFLAIDKDEHLDAVEFLATVEKILSPSDIFGLEKYLAQGTHLQRLHLHSSRQKNEVVEKVAQFAESVGFPSRLSQGLAVVADELVTNGLYNAPVDARGTPRYARFARNVPVDLADHEAVQLCMAFDGRKFGISASDPFGSLPPMTVVDYLAKCFRKGDDQIDSKEGGAGLGLYKLFSLLQHFVVNIAPGRRTETIGLLDVTRSYREFAVRGKSFNLFVVETKM